MPPSIAALVFDAYGTLFDVHSVVERCERHFPSRGAELSRLWRARQLEYSWLTSLMGRHRDFRRLTGDALSVACRALGLSCPDEVHADLLAAYDRLDTFPEVKRALAALKGTPLAILSNGSPEMLRAAVAHAGLQDVFAAVMSVEDAGIFKPHPAVYALAPARLKLPKEAIGFVSANGWDVAGAASFGLRAFWINRTGAPAESLPGQPERVLTSLDELGAIANV